MMRKILIVASSDYFVRIFLLPHLRELQKRGWQVDVASAYDGENLPYINKHIDIPIQRTPFSMKNVQAIRLLAGVIEEERYDVVHCHTPIGAYVGRLAARKARRLYGTKVIYTAHGFHFYKGSSLLSWLLYYPAEKILAPYTDAIITINHEDYERVQKQFTVIPRRYFMNGIGLDVSRIQNDPQRVALLRKELGIAEGDFVMIYVANLIPGKNHRFLLSCMPQIVKEIPCCKLLLCGSGNLQQWLEREIAGMHLQDHVILTGFKRNIGNYYALADMALSTSKREGLPVNVLESLYYRLPMVLSRISGHVDLVTDGYNGLLYTPGNRRQFIEEVIALYRMPHWRESLAKHAAYELEKYMAPQVVAEMMDIYDSLTAKPDRT